ADADRLLAGRTGDHLDAGIEHVDLLLLDRKQSRRAGIRTDLVRGRLLFFQLGFEIDVRFSATEQLAEHSLEMLANRVERLLEADAALAVDLIDQFLELLLGAGQVRELSGQELRPLLQLILLADGVEVDVAEAMDFVAELLD